MKYVSIPVLVLFFGMVSCQSDKKTTKAEEFRIQEPKIVLKKSNDHKNFNAFSQQVKPDLTLADELQFQEEAGKFNILYNVSCRFEKKETVQSGFISNPKNTRFLSFLNPEQLRMIGETKDGAPCSFDFIAISPNGSKHNFKLALVQLKDDESASEISILHPKAPNAVSQITFEQWQDYFIKLAKSGESNIVFNCSSGEKTISINQTDRLNLSAAPLQEFSFNWNSSLQTCRISQLQNSIVVGTSKNFILFSPSLAIPTKGSLGHHPRQANAPLHPQLASFSYILEISNPYSYPIRLRLPKQEIRLSDAPNTYQYPSVLYANKGGASIEWIYDTVIVLEPQKTLQVFHYVFVNASNCRLIANNSIHNRNTIQIQQLSEVFNNNNEPIVLNKFEIPPYSIPVQYGGEHSDFINLCNR